MAHLSDYITELFDLSGKVAVVTGGSMGLGREMAIALAKAGADVAVVGRTLATLEEAVLDLTALGRRAIAAQANVSAVTDVHRLVTDVVHQLGRIDILVNAAGITVYKPVQDTRVSDWTAVLDVNLKGSFLCCQAVGQVMIEQGYGKIINVASVNTAVAIPRQIAYSASQGGIAAVTRALAVEWGQHNVSVNAIAPGFFQTRFTRDLFDDEQWYSHFKQTVPLKRPGNPTDLAGATVFLASRASDYVTGQILYVDGGFVAGENL